MDALFAVCVKIGSKDARGTFHFRSTGSLAVILGIAFVGSKIARRHRTLEPEKFGTNEATVFCFRLFEQLLHHAVAMCFTLAISCLGLTVAKSGKDYQSTDGSAHHAQTPHSAAKAGRYKSGLLVAKAIEVGKGPHYTLTAAIATHKKFDSTLYSFFVCHRFFYYSMR